MSSEVIKQYIKDIEAENIYDSEYIKIFRACNEDNKDGQIAAREMTALITKRYAKNQKDTA